MTSIAAAKGLKALPRSRPLSERFWEKAEKRGPGECWEWTAARNEHGYGRFKIDRAESRLAHRVAYELEHGDIQEGACICHTCDNPPCVNPAHLWQGSMGDNNEDMRRKGRLVMPELAGADHPGSVLTKVEAQDAMALYGKGWSQASIARLFDVSKSCIWRLVNGYAWKELHDELLGEPTLPAHRDKPCAGIGPDPLRGGAGQIFRSSD